MDKKNLQDKINENILQSKIKKCERENITNKLVYYVSTNKLKFTKNYDEQRSMILAKRKMQIEDTFKLTNHDLLFEKPNIIMEKTNYYLSKVYGWIIYGICGFENKCWIVENNEEYDGCGCFLIFSNDKYVINIEFIYRTQIKKDIYKSQIKKIQSDLDKGYKYFVEFTIYRKEKIFDKELQFIECLYQNMNGMRFDNKIPKKIKDYQIEKQREIIIEDSVIYPLKKINKVLKYYLKLYSIL